jgi:hypothetical protein
MGKGAGKPQVTTQAVDPATAAYAKQIHDAAGAAAGNYSTVGPNAATTDALGNYSQYASAGLNGLAALGGDPSAMARFQNPYQQQVVDASNANFEKTNAMVGNAADSAATAAGAFGGSRAAVQKGAAQGEAQGAHDQQIAGLLDQGYNNAQTQAGNVANLGMGATGQIANIGDYLRQIQQQQANPDAARLQLLQQGVTAPTSQTTTTPGQKRNGIAGALGGAISGFATTGSPWGAAAGGLAGLWG